MQFHSGQTICKTLFHYSKLTGNAYAGIYNLFLYKCTLYLQLDRSYLIPVQSLCKAEVSPEHLLRTVRSNYSLSALAWNLGNGENLSTKNIEKIIHQGMTIVVSILGQCVPTVSFFIFTLFSYGYNVPVNLPPTATLPPQ